MLSDYKTTKVFIKWSNMAGKETIY